MYSRPDTRDHEFSTLLRERYGTPRGRRSPAPDRAVQLTVDTGEEMLQRPVVIQEDDYVVDRPEPPGDGPSPAPPSAAPTPAPGPHRVAPSDPEAATSAVPLEPPRPPAEPALVRPPNDVPNASTPPAPAPPAPVPTTSAPTLPEPTASPPQVESTPKPVSGLTDADLAADMQAILGGGAVFDHSTGRVRPRPMSEHAAAIEAGPDTPVTEPASSPAQQTGSERPLPDAADEQSIFDRIARSMEHANSFDLGTHELRSRFNRLERADEARRHRRSPSAPPGDRAPRTSAATPLAPMTHDPVAGLRAEDFAAVYEQRVPGRSTGCAGAGAAAAFATRPGDGHSAPMFDTGEHVLSAGDLHPDRLVVGRAPGVAFSYGQIIAMADFYATVDDLLAADSAELNRLKSLIQRNTAYYEGGKRDPSGEVGNDEWDRATNDRYMRLAEANYDHFAPASLLGLPGTQTQYDHRRRWDELHRRALSEKAGLVLAHPDSSAFPMGPLTVNAFADHFLTDAFAAGHLVNKEILMSRFRSRFFTTPGTLTADANTFFDQVADRAWTPKVSEAMRRLEPTSPPDALCSHGWCLPLLPNIRTAGMFAEVLKQAAVAEPGKISNLAVKVLHDKLNSDGVDVVNGTGDSWRLTGDGHLNDDTLRVMRRAVDQSVANLDDSSFLASNANHDPLVARVWRYTPLPTPASRVALTRAVDTYTDPRSADFVAATANLVNEQIDVLVKALVASGRMQEGGGI